MPAPYNRTPAVFQTLSEHLFPDASQGLGPRLVHHLVVEPGVLPLRRLRGPAQRLDPGGADDLVPPDGALDVSVRLRVLVLPLAAEGVDARLVDVAVRPRRPPRRGRVVRDAPLLLRLQGLDLGRRDVLVASG
ncbi:hypothetical protein DL764_009448 [Monosporascus ibericus]|uniref:Uncharacterized protein n=1 Tax=Monosporascus ibericus TaxID=155417 RepID=A0A4Q4SUZ3_9PEZI|nr:hypothetical protein DL764_009448 [Monosporascus ibericus]